MCSIGQCYPMFGAALALVLVGLYVLATSVLGAWFLSRFKVLAQIEMRKAGEKKEGDKSQRPWITWLLFIVLIALIIWLVVTNG